MSESPSYIKALLRPNGSKPQGRRVWSIDLEAVWLPFFTATNTMGDTAISPEALGAPLRLAYNQDGSPKFGKTGRPVVRVVKDLADHVRLIRENFVAGLAAYANGIVAECPDGYKAQVLAAQEAGRPIMEHDRAALLATIEPVGEPVGEPAGEPVGEPVVEPAGEPVGEPHKGKAKVKQAVAA